ncbi:MAG TPA: DUF4233 domain-containing protein [Jiangellaceae bacterium]|nr:DUF4233 domain-containing protein [Jiangellaceae bacterium]
MSRIAMSMMVIEAIVLTLTIPVGIAGPELGTGQAWAFGGGLAVLAVVAAGLLRRGRAGYVVGTVVQVGALAMGFWLPMMFFLGGIFALLWFVLLRIGPEVERAKAAREAADGLE